MPNLYTNFIPSMARGAMVNGARGLGSNIGIGRGINLFQRLGNGIHALRGINWSGIINNTSKTLGVINQAIPVVKQVGPMMNNVRSMLKIASVFKDETDLKVPKKGISHYAKNSSYSSSDIHHDSVSSNLDDYSPTFFVGA